jgi:6-pyruvoyltetrahydropterin/6-carboxytetrahydropterin synthase
VISIERYHDISCGHRVVGHESKCRHLHGHNYRITFVCVADELDSIGRVLDFSAVKERLCMWLEDEWDHKFLAWVDDDFMNNLCPLASDVEDSRLFVASVVWTPFNPTAENMADYLLRVVAPQRLEGTGVTCISVRVEETRKCSATADRMMNMDANGRMRPL